jgi:hypothetical protein
MKKHLHITFVSLFFILGFISCNKNNNSITPTKKTNSGIFGKVLLYDEYGELQSDYSGITITGYCLDSTYLIDTIHKKYFDSTFTVVSDPSGNFSVLKCHQGVYVFTFAKDQFGTHKFVGFEHSSSSGDTLKNVFLSKSTLATVHIDSVRVSSDNKLLFINRTVSLTGSSSKTYAVVTRYFFSNSPNVTDKLYSYEWVSGATQGVGGFVSSVQVQKSTDKFSTSGINLNKQIYVRAYIDNIKYYQYKDSVKATKMVFPNVVSPSNIVSVKVDSI